MTIKLNQVPDRYEAAVRLERARQIVRECSRYGFAVTLTDATELQDAERDYDLATEGAIRRAARRQRRTITA